MADIALSLQKLKTKQQFKSYTALKNNVIWFTLGPLRVMRISK